MVTVPETSRPSITAFGVVTVIAPDAFSDVPAGTPVSPGPGHLTVEPHGATGEGEALGRPLREFSGSGDSEAESGSLSEGPVHALAPWSPAVGTSRQIASDRLSRPSPVLGLDVPPVNVQPVSISLRKAARVTVAASESRLAGSRWCTPWSRRLVGEATSPARRFDTVVTARPACDQGGSGGGRAADGDVAVSG